MEFTCHADKVKFDKYFYTNTFIVTNAIKEHIVKIPSGSDENLMSYEFA